MAFFLRRIRRADVAQTWLTARICAKIFVNESGVKFPLQTFGKTA
jgi:hypothetical protein